MFIELLESISKEKSKELYGKYLFGELLNKSERDTKLESKIYLLLKQYIQESEINDRFINLLKELRDSKVHFPDILKPDANVVYRGSVIDLHKEGIDLQDAKFEKRLKWNFYIINNYNYKSQNKLQSYSTSFKIAHNFAYNSEATSHNKNAVPCIYEVKVQDDFLFNTYITNLIAKKVGHNPEDEIIRLSNKPIKAKLYIEIE